MVCIDVMKVQMHKSLLGLCSYHARTVCLAIRRSYGLTIPNQGSSIQNTYGKVDVNRLTDMSGTEALDQAALVCMIGHIKNCILLMWYAVTIMDDTARVAFSSLDEQCNVFCTHSSCMTSAHQFRHAVPND